MTTYEDVCTYLFTLPRFADQGPAAYHPSLEKMKGLMAEMGHPHCMFESVHVAGTNGKGSTSSMVAAMATANGQRTGLHTSPHLYDFTERMRIDGVPAPHDWVIEAVRRFRGLFDQLKPSFFEASTALSFLYFAEQGVDLGVIEVGMGGRLDATNVIEPRLALISQIGFDHTQQLGATLPEIAREKAGIIKPQTIVLSTATQPEIIDVLREVALQHRVPFHLVHEEAEIVDRRSLETGTVLDIRTPVRMYRDVEVALPGRHQETNALLAIRAAECLPDLIAASSISAGLAGVPRLAGLRARCEILQLEPLIMADVAHNAEGLKATLHVVQSIATAKRGGLYVLFGVMRDKPVEAMIDLLAEARAVVLPVSVSADRSLPRVELHRLLARYPVTVREVGGVSEGVDWFLKHCNPEDKLLITGSHRVVASLPTTLF
jgi:dihydrofolate synthase/folylpolyglutamate synthase